MFWWLLIPILYATTNTALRLHQHTNSPQQCVDLQCPATSFDYGKKKLVNEETLSSEPCRNCQQCTSAGYSVCLKPRLLNRAKRQSSLHQMATCSCAHSLPANCHNELSRTTHPANITMQLFNVCYLSSLQSPPPPLAVNSKKNVIVTVEPFWEEPYWKDLDLENLTLTYTYFVKVPEHCDGDVITNEQKGGEEATHVCTARLKIGMSTEDKTGEEEYEHSENYMYEDDLPPEVDFDRDVFAGAKIVNFSYKVNARRPRQLRLRSESSDPFEDLVTVVESEILAHDMKPELYGTGLEDQNGPKDPVKEVDDQMKVESQEDKEEKEEKEEKEKDGMKIHDDKPSQGEQINEEAVSEEEGEGPENLPGTDFFNDDGKEKSEKEMSEEEKKEEEEEQKQEEEEQKEQDEIAKEEKEERDQEETLERDKEIGEKEGHTGSEEEIKEKEHQGEDKEDHKEEKVNSKELDKEDEDKEKEKEDEKVLPLDDQDVKEKEEVEKKKEIEEEEKKEEEKEEEKEEKEEEDEDGSGKEEGEGEEEGETVSWYQHLKEFFTTDSRAHLVRWVFSVTIVACLLLICIVCTRRRCVARTKHQQKTANGVRYEAANTSSSIIPPSSQGIEKHNHHQLMSVRSPLIDPEMNLSRETAMETSQEELSYRYNSATLSLKNLASNDLEICALIGRGRFGSIHRGMLHTERGGMKDCTVYWLQTPSAMPPVEMRVLVKALEMGVQSGMASTHISIHGISYNNEASLVVLDPLWEPDLRAVLRESRSARFASENLRSASFLSAERLFSMMKEITIAVKTLTSRKIFHPSLCSANILVGDRGHVKISGFSLAEHRSLTARKDEKTPRLLRWQSPRVLSLPKDESRLEEADLVWSLGIVLWEIASLGGTPYAKIRNESELRIRIPNETAKIDHPAYVDLPLRQLIDECLRVEATKRIDFESLQKRIDCLAVDAQKHLLLVLPYDGESPSTERSSKIRGNTFEYSPIVLPFE